MTSDDKYPVGRDENIVTYKESGRKTYRTSIVMYDTDGVLVDYIAEYLGCSRSEAIRSAIRAFATNLSTIQKGGGKT